jgi:hypothetical protein
MQSINYKRNYDKISQLTLKNNKHYNLIVKQINKSVEINNT